MHRRPPASRSRAGNDGAEPNLNGKGLALYPYEIARSLAVAPDGRRCVLGAEWSLRLFDRDGTELWPARASAPSGR